MREDAAEGCFGCIIATFLLFAILGFVQMSQNKAPKPKEMTTQDAVRIMSDAHNKQQRLIRKLETELDQVKRQLAGELPQIHGGVSYETK